jgi:hypothetical protein
LVVKSPGSTGELLPLLQDLSAKGAGGIPGVAVECVDIWENAKGEGSLLGRN